MKTITEKTVIVLTLEGGQWFANWSGPESAKVKELFGTGKIPTPFRASAKPEEVLESIQKLNPEYQVSIAPANDPYVIRDEEGFYYGVAGMVTNKSSAFEYATIANAFTAMQRAARLFPCLRIEHMSGLSCEGEDIG